MLESKKIVLATQSSSRVSLVKQNNLDWDCVKNTFNESEYKANFKILPTLQSVQNLTMDLAYHKALSVKDIYLDTLIIGCDTVVLCKGKILEKPKDLKEAKKMLDFLQNSYQYVITGVALYDSKTNKCKTFCEITKMIFNNFGEKEYNYLLVETNPLENAGGYEYDEHIAPKTIIIRGTSDNVIGIPLKKIIKTINNL